MHTRKKTLIVVAFLLLLVAALNVADLVIHILNDRRYTAEFDELRSIVAEHEASVDDTTDSQNGRAVALAELMAQNPDMVGWVSIEDTDLDYPVMHTPDDPEYYLRRNYEKQDSEHGTPFLSADCDLDKPSDNLVIYGHHIKNGKMFGSLHSYTEKEYWQKHPYVVFETPDDQFTYEIFAVIRLQVYTNDPNLFQYYLCTDFENGDDFDEYLAQLSLYRLYDTDITPQYGEQLITLSTCEYTLENGRLVVIGRLISQPQARHFSSRPMILPSPS